MSDGIDFPGYSRKPGVEQLAIHRFDAAAGHWVEAPGEASAAEIPRLSFATFNTWFQGGDRDVRYPALSRALEASGADVIVLQEVTIPLLDHLQSLPWLRAAYRFARAPFRIDAIPAHGVMLWSRLPIRNAVLHPLPTHMGRGLLTAHGRINAHPVTFATVHLDSMKSHADTRAEQLDAIFPILASAGTTLLGGDFNFSPADRLETSRLDPSYVDTWAHANPGDPGFTQDTARNPMLAAAKGAARQVRIDRVFLKSPAGAGWKIESARLLGSECADAKHPRIFASDHFGVLATFAAY